MRRTIVSAIPTSRYPLDVTFNPSGTRAFVATGYSLSIVDVALGTIVGDIDVHGAPQRLLISPDGRWLYATTSYAQAVKVDLITNAIVAEILTRSSSSLDGNGIALTRDGSRLYVSTPGNVLIEHDAATLTELRRWALGVPNSHLQEVVLSPDEKELYVASEGGPLYGFDLASGTKTFEHDFGWSYGPFGMALSPDGKSLWVTMTRHGEVDVFELASRSVTRTMTVQGGPRRVAFAPNGTALVTNDAGWVTFVK